MTAPDMMPENVRTTEDRSVDIMISNILRIGLLSACSLMIVGAVIEFIQNPHANLQLRQFHSEPLELRTLSGIAHGVLSGEGLSIMQAAVLLLLATPFMRVAFSAYVFAKQRDWKYVVVSLIVLGILIFGLFAGHATE